jgi:hypothetical protein
LKKERGEGRGNGIVMQVHNTLIILTSPPAPLLEEGEG